MRIPPSKSITHRALIGASLSHGRSAVLFPSVCDDTLATARALEQMGIGILRLTPQDDTPEEKWIVHGGLWKPPEEPIHCRESATTWRLLTAITDTLEIPCAFTGAPGLLQRGQRPNPQQSSQYLSGLLLAAPCGKKDFQLTLDESAVSRPYIDLTLTVQKKFGIDVMTDGTTYRIEPQTYKPADITVEGDWSAAAFFIAMGLLHKTIVLENLRADSVQGDKAILSIVQEMGGRFEWREGNLVVDPSPLRGIRWNFQNTPDLYPVAAVLAHCAKGENRFEGTERLRTKESDRLAETEKLLQAQNGSVIDSKDHRIIMAAAVLALAKGSVFQYRHPEAVSKSYPGFWKDYGQYAR